jgi:hypothetical protein
MNLNDGVDATKAEPQLILRKQNASGSALMQ